MNTTLTKTELVKDIAIIHGLSDAQAERIFESCLSGISAALVAGRRVEFRGFGVWNVRLGKERVGRNPRRPDDGPLTIPARRVVRFKVGKDLKTAIQNRTAT